MTKIIWDWSKISAILLVLLYVPWATFFLEVMLPFPTFKFKSYFGWWNSCYLTSIYSKEYEDLSIKAKSRFSISLRSLTQPMSLGEIARTWDNCARAVISEYAQQSGGGTFSSKYGTWENCLSAAWVKEEWRR